VEVSMSRPTTGRTVAVLVLAGLAVLTSLAGCGSGGHPAAAGSATPTPQPAAPVTSAPATTAAPSSPAPAPTSPAPPSPTPRSSSAPRSPAPPGPELLREGASGPEVLALQRRLVELGYWLGTPDGRFGPSTAHALTALQKMSGIGRDGVVGPDTRRALEHATRPRPRSGGGTLFEVDLARQVLLIVRDGRVEWALDTSTGAVAGTTPTGRYSVFRQVDGYDTSPLGVLYRPKYFVGGVAVHGYPSVPPYPASHGCVRVTNDAMDWLWSTGRLPIGMRVWVY